MWVLDNNRMGDDEAGLIGPFASEDGAWVYAAMFLEKFDLKYAQAREVVAP
jgi:hypothetical protein